MRFLNTQTLRFEQIPDSELHLEENQYAILSHRWGANEDEITFDDIRSSKQFTNKKSFSKVKGFCQIASSVNFQYGWVDTCCISKENSSVLSEAINSMYRWYQGSKICIAYLEDVPEKKLTDSDWFDRGWTLQELIGPKAVVFYDHDWNFIGTKTKLIAELSWKTRIPESVLSHTIEPSACSIAQRMSWAANRVTTRVEDRAYSLMGLFDVNMPMIYGEREKAFLRLQQHIVQKSKDESLFAWAMDFPGNKRTYSGLFAPSPLAYASCSDVVQTQGSRGFSESNGELSILSSISPHIPETYSALLHCTNRSSPDSRTFILIARTSIKGEFVRVRGVDSVSQGLVHSDRWLRFKELQVHVSMDPSNPPLNIFSGFLLQTIEPPDHGVCDTTILSNSQTAQADHACQDNFHQGVAGIVHIEPKNNSGNPGWSKVRWITVSFDEDFNPVLWLANDENSQRLHDKFAQAEASAANSWERKQIMEYCKTDTETRWPSGEIAAEEDGRQEDGLLPFSTKELWPKGALVVNVNRKEGFRRRLFAGLNLRISVQLQPYLCPSRIPTGNVDDGGLPLNPKVIWVVDFTDTGGESPEERERQWRKMIRTAQLTSFLTSTMFLILILSPYVVILLWVFYKLIPQNIN